MSTAVEAATALSGIPDELRTPLIEEYSKIAANYREGRWEPAELNGGKICEIVYTILKGYTDGSFPSSPAKPDNMVDACRRLEQATSFPRPIRIQIPRLLLGLYEIRNNRNVGHVGADVNPNYMDATIVLSMVKWIIAELVRVFHNVTTEAATEIVEGLTERSIPILWKVNGSVKVLGPSMSAREKLLALLYGSTGTLSVAVAIKSIEYSNSSRLRASVLPLMHREQLLHWDRGADTLTLTPIGARFVEEHIKLDL